MSMTAGEWLGCSLIEVVPGKASGAAVFKNMRLPVNAVVGNVDAFLDEGLSLDQAIAETLDCYPEIPGGVDGIKAVIVYRDAHEHQLMA